MKHNNNESVKRFSLISEILYWLQKNA